MKIANSSVTLKNLTTLQVLAKFTVLLLQKC
jgi:hypothetical protein